MQTTRLLFTALSFVLLFSSCGSTAQTESKTQTQSTAQTQPAGQTQEKRFDKIQWMTLQEAASKTQQQPKKIFIDFYTTWCGWCKRMDATTFQDPAIVDYINKNFYAIKFNAETHDTVQFKDKSYVFKPEYKSNEFAAQMLNGQMSYPTTVYIDESLALIGPVPGYLTGEQLLPVLKYFAENIYKTKKWEEYVKENVKK